MQRILIVEDDEKLRHELKIFLGRNGYEAFGLENFENTLEDMLQADAHLILLDINLPNVDGEYLLKEIRKGSGLKLIWRIKLYSRIQNGVSSF